MAEVQQGDSLLRPSLVLLAPLLFLLNFLSLLTPDSLVLPSLFLFLLTLLISFRLFYSPFRFFSPS